MTAVETVAPSRSMTPDIVKLKTYLAATVVNELGANPPPPGQSHQFLEKTLNDIYTRLQITLPEAIRVKVFQEVIDELEGYGPIQPFLEDPAVSEVMINGTKLVFIERDGELVETGITFDDEAHLLRVINRLIHPLGQRVDANSPTVDARLPDGSRVNAVIPPVAVDGPYVTIRKFLPNRMSAEEIIALGSITSHMVEFLQACVAARLNILISGGSSSGKTTMLNILSGMIPGNERIITIEDTVELQLKQRHVVRMETKVRNVNGGGEVTTRDLIRNALRMRPDRIIVGEVRGGESIDLLQAMNIGYSGSITTLHANSPRDAISRMENSAMIAGLEIPAVAVRKQIAAAFHLIIHLVRLQDGTRKTTHITEVAGMENDSVVLNDIFKFEQTGVRTDGKVKGELRATSARPLFAPRLEVVGYKLRGEVFGTRRL